MLYGANGYTGTLTAELAQARGLAPVLAGRNQVELEALGTRLGLEVRVFDLRDPATIRQQLDGVRAVLHMAGPFTSTSAPLVDACLDIGCHYLDITGEYSVFESIWRRHHQAMQAGCVLLPGVGFDVVPTDCLAGLLHRGLPDATQLELAFATLGTHPSPGTVNTWIEALGKGGLVRVDGKIVHEPLGTRARDIPFPTQTLHSVAVPIGDLSSAFRTTGIPTITAYMALPKPAQLGLRGLAAMRAVFASPQVARGLKRWVPRAVQGPNASERSRSRGELWGEVRNAAGARFSLTLTTPDPYALTADAALRSAERVLAGRVAPGASTPAQALGADFVTECDGVQVSSKMP